MTRAVKLPYLRLITRVIVGVVLLGAYATQSGEGLINGLLDKSEVLEMSSSGEAMILSRGLIEGLKVGQRGQFFRQIGRDSPQIEALGVGECVKVYKTKSFWMLSKISPENPIKKGMLLALVTQEAQLAGRAPWKILNKQVVLSAQQKIGKQKYNTGLPVYRDKQRAFEKQLIFTRMPNKWRAENIQYSIWQKKNSQRDYAPEYDAKLVALESSHRQLGRAPAQLREELKAQASETSMQGAMAKPAKEQFGLAGLYYEQRRDPEIPFMQVAASYRNTYKLAQEKKAEKIFSRPALAKLYKEGGSWTRDMSSAQIRRYFSKSGVLEELSLQKYAFENIPGNELFFRMGRGMNAHSTTEDPQNQGTGSAYSFGYEYQFSKIFDQLKSWTADVSIASQKNFYSLSDSAAVNGKSSEIIYRLYLNWYLINEPTGLNKFMAYLGVGVGLGTAKINSASFIQEYKYSIQMPISYQFGIKYRFKLRGIDNERAKVGFSLNSLLTYESKSLSSDEDLPDNIDGNKQVNDIKLSLGVGLYF